MKNIRSIFVCVLVFTAIISKGQTIDGGTRSWVTLLNKVEFNDKFGIFNEIHERPGGIFQNQGQFLIRPSIYYSYNSNTEFSVGYTFIRTWPFAPFNQPMPANENNAWEQVFLKHTIGKFKIASRIRQEHRFRDNIALQQDGTYKIDGFNYANRFRYRFIVSFPLYSFSESGRSIFFNGFNEFWINQNQKNLVFSSLGRNWLYLGLGYKFNSTTNVQLGYMNQINYGSVKDVTQIIQFTFYKSFSFKNKQEN